MQVTIDFVITNNNRETGVNVVSLPLGQGYVFTRVCDSVQSGGVCPIACWDTSPGPEAAPPPQGPEAGTLPGPEAGTNWTRHPPGAKHPPGLEAGTPRDQRQPPPWDQAPPSRRCSACWEIRATSGWYASYWNAILLVNRY